MANKIQLRRGTAAEWTASNPLLSAGEVGFETDTGKFKIGDGVLYWSALNYFGNEVDLSGYLTISSASTNYLQHNTGFLWQNGNIIDNVYFPGGLSILSVDESDTYLQHFGLSGNDLVISSQNSSDNSYKDVYLNQIASGNEITTHNWVIAQNYLTESNAALTYLNNTNASVSMATSGSAVVRNITLSTSNPSGGNDGDVWMVYS